MREIDLTNDEDEEFIGLAGMEAVMNAMIDLANDDDTEVDENGDIGHANGEADVVVAPLDVVAIDDVPAPAPAVPAVDVPRRTKKISLLDDSSDEGGDGGSPSKQLRGFVRMEDVAAVGGGLATGQGLSPITMATNARLLIGDDLSVGDRDYMNRYMNRAAVEHS